MQFSILKNLNLLFQNNLSNKENEENYIKMRQKGFSDPVYGNNYPAFAKAAKESLTENPVDWSKPSPYQQTLRQLSQTTFTNKGGKTKRNKRRNRKTKSRRYRH